MILLRENLTTCIIDWYINNTQRRIILVCVHCVIQKRNKKKGGKKRKLRHMRGLCYHVSLGDQGGCGEGAINSTKRNGSASAGLNAYLIATLKCGAVTCGGCYALRREVCRFLRVSRWRSVNVEGRCEISLSFCATSGCFMLRWSWNRLIDPCKISRKLRQYAQKILYSCRTTRCSLSACGAKPV